MDLMYNLARPLGIRTLAIFRAVGAPFSTHAVSDAPVIVRLDADKYPEAAVEAPKLRSMKSMRRAASSVAN